LQQLHATFEQHAINSRHYAPELFRRGAEAHFAEL
jgi:hypothetical protein